MVIDLAQAGGDADGLRRRLRSRVCIIGGGIAGLFLAQQVAAKAISVTLLEAGGATARDGEAAKGETDPFGAELVGRAHLGTAHGRARGLGGCSHTWGGQLLALTEDANWPIPSAELAASTERVLTQLGLSATAGGAGRGTVPLPFALQEEAGLCARFSTFLPFSERNFAQTLGKKLAWLAQVTVGLHAPVVELLPAPEGERIVAARVQRPDGTTLLVEADHFVLAAGAVETCRLLLASRGRALEGVGNDFGQVGLHFHDHLTVAAASFQGPARRRVLQEMRPFVQRLGVQRLGMRRLGVQSLKLEASPKLQKELNLFPAMAHLTIGEPETTGVGALRHLLRAQQRGRVINALWTGARTLPNVAVHGFRLLWQAYTQHRRYVSPSAEVVLQLNMAQGAGSGGRVLLSQTEDCWGMPKAVVQWGVTAAELGNLRRFAGYLRVLVAGAGIEDGATWLPALFSESEASDRALLACLDDARHAMGGARMGVDPRQSVVDPELRVHGVANLSVAGAAVFPDGSAQLPTLTLLALCVRLADRLCAELG